MPTLQIGRVHARPDLAGWICSLWRIGPQMAVCVAPSPPSEGEEVAQFKFAVEGVHMYVYSGDIHRSGDSAARKAVVSISIAS